MTSKPSAIMMVKHVFVDMIRIASSLVQLLCGVYLLYEAINLN